MIFTYMKISLLSVMLFSSAWAFSQDIGTGTGWGELIPGEDLVINQNFQGFEFFHSDENPDQGNSDHQMDETSGNIIYNYKDMDADLPYEGSAVNYRMSFKQCAFAPEWSTAYAYKNETENTEKVTNGFVEVSRDDEIYSSIPTTRGHMLVDLTGLKSVEIIQYSHSSTGGSKRGIMVEFSIDSGETWDTLRYQPGEKYTGSFTRDPFTGETTVNDYRCDPSAYGMLWEDPIYWYDGGFMLRFSDSAGQTIRMHDLKVYGQVDAPVGVESVSQSLSITLNQHELQLSDVSDVEIYSISGELVKSAQYTRKISLSDLQNGVYVVKASANSEQAIRKIVLN